MRDYYNTIAINLHYSDWGSHIANLTSIIQYNLAGSTVENKTHVCYDYTTDGTYDVCYSQASSYSACGLSCTQVPDVLTANIQIDFATIGAVGDFTLTALSYNGQSTVNDTQDYVIFYEDPVYVTEAVISPTDYDDDLNDDFIINLQDYQNLSMNITNETTWNFIWSSSDSLLGEDEINFACWKTNLDSEWDVCYMEDGGYNPYCGMNCTDAPWYNYYNIDNSNYISEYSYYVTLYVGNLNTSSGALSTQEFIFNPITAEEDAAVKMYVVVAVAAFIGVLLLFAGFLFILLSFVLFLFVIGARFFRRKRRKRD